MTDDTVTDDVQNEVPAGDEQPAGTGGLTISDLRVLKMCVEAGSSRGAYQANEMSTVGNTYNRLAMFLAQIDAQQAEANADAEGDEENNETTEETVEE